MKRFKQVLTIVLAAVLLLTGCAGGAASTWQEKYDLGVRYLSEGNYEEAIFAFQAAITIDPKNPQAHVGVGDAYMAIAAQSTDTAEKAEALRKAKDWYEQALEKGDESAADKAAEAQEALDALGQGGDAPLVKALAVLTEERFDYAEEFRNGYAFAIRGLDCGYIDTQGNFTVYYQRADPEPYEELGTSDFRLWLYLNSDHMQMWVSEEGLFPLYDRASGLWGYGDIHTGEVVIAPAYVDACPFSEGRAVVQRVEEPGDEFGMPQKYAVVIDTEGNELFTAYSLMLSDQGDELAYQDGTLWLVGRDKDDDEQRYAYLVDRDGNVLDQLALFGISAGFTVHDDPDYVAEDQFSRGDPAYMCISRASGETYYLDSTGSRTAQIPEGASRGYVWIEGERAAFYAQDGGIGLFDEDGAITPPQWLNAMWLNRGLAAVTEDNVQYYLVNDRGERVGGEVFESAGNFSEEGLLAVRQNGLWGYADMTGQIVIPCQFAAAYTFSNGVAAVSRADGAQTTYINTKGEDITGDIHALQNWYTCEEGFYLIEEAEGWRHIHHAG